jgi:large subunit ribosomal protein L7/L12
VFVGFLRKTLLIGTGGLAPVKPNSKKERTAKAAEKQLRVQQQILKEQRANAAVVRPASTTIALAPRPAAEPVLDGSTADVRLTGAGERKIQVIKIVRNVTGLGLKEAKALVDHVPSDVLHGIDAADAEQLKAAIEGAGGTAETIIHDAAPASAAAAVDSTAPQAPASSGHVAEDLERLASLRERGMLTDDEFADAKARVISHP